MRFLSLLLAFAPLLLLGGAVLLFRRAPRIAARVVRNRSLYLVATLLAGGAAHAQQQTCSGAFDALLGLRVPGPSGSQSVASPGIERVFGRAECQCRSADIQLELRITKPIPLSMSSGTLDIWVGTGCEQSITRQMSGQTQCEQLPLPAGLTYQSFVLGSGGSSPILIPIPAEKLFAPKDLHPNCALTVASNDLYVIVTPQGTDPTLASVCKLSLTEAGLPPAPPVAVTASAASDDSVSVVWQSPFGATVAPASYQILCADADGNPVPGQGGHAQAYSVCIGDQIFRRNDLPLAAQDQPLGTENSADLGISPQPIPSSLDPRFICSDKIELTGVSLTTSITGLSAGSRYQFVVLSIDSYGNPTASSVVMAATAPSAPGITAMHAGCSLAATRSAPSGALALLLLFAAVTLRRQRWDSRAPMSAMATVPRNATGRGQPK